MNAWNVKTPAEWCNASYFWNRKRHCKHPLNKGEKPERKVFKLMQFPICSYENCPIKIIDDN